MSEPTKASDIPLPWDQVQKPDMTDERNLSPEELTARMARFVKLNSELFGTCLHCEKPIEFKPKENWIEDFKRHYKRIWIDRDCKFLSFDTFPHDQCKIDHLTTMAKRNYPECLAAYLNNNDQILTSRFTKSVKRFKELIVDEQNDKAISILKRWRNDDEFGFFIIGPCGSGKSTILAALYLKILDFYNESDTLFTPFLAETIRLKDNTYKRLEGPTFYWINTIEMFCMLRREIEGNNKPFLEQLVVRDFLFIDDFGSENTTEWTREQIHLVLDARLRLKRRTFFSTNLTLEEIKAKYHERFLSRIKESCVIVELGGSDRRTDIMKERLQTLKARAN